MNQSTFNFEEQPTSTALTVSQVIKQLKDQNQDFEWYPTTDTMLNAITDDFASIRGNRNSIDVMDVGCGDGRVLLHWQNAKFKTCSYDERKSSITNHLYGIEKAEVHLQGLLKSEDITILGTDFYNTSFVGKKTDVLFCNPPYSDFEFWISKLIMEGFFRVAYFVIPQRWKNSVEIKKALAYRGYEDFTTVIYSDDFINADRQARAKIDIVRIVPKSACYSGVVNISYGNDEDIDPFHSWFDNTFRLNLDEDNHDQAEKNKEVCREVFVKSNTLQELEDFYFKDLEQINKNYNALSELDPQLFKELGVNISNLKTSVRNRIKDLKENYWRNFFDYYEPINSRLTSESRRRLYHVTQELSMLDFNVSNMIYITQKVIHEANSYQNQQILDLFDDLSKADNIIKYKSNQRVFNKNDWRYLKDEFSHYKLDYRIIGTYQTSYYSNHIPSYNISNSINDICIVLKTLSFLTENNSLNGEYNAYYGDRYEIILHEFGTGKTDIAFDVKYYKNGNRHIRFNQKVMLALNVAVGRLKGWIRTAEQASEELGESLEKVQEVYGLSDHIAITSNHIQNLPRLN